MLSCIVLRFANDHTNLKLRPITYLIPKEKKESAQKNRTRAALTQTLTNLTNKCNCQDGVCKLAKRSLAYMLWRHLANQSNHYESLPMHLTGLFNGKYNLEAIFTI